MKKICFIYSIVILSVFSSVSLADNTQYPPAILYCPFKIICSINNKLDSCNIEGNLFQYWKIVANEGKVIKGTYNLKKVESKYQFPEIIGEVFCQYNNIENGIERLINVWKFVPNNFEAYYTKTTKWNIIGYQAECFSDNPQSCPLIEKPELIFTTNGYWTADFYTKNNPYIPIRVPMTYEAAVSACGSISQCEINVHTKSAQGGFNAGYVIIDLTINDFIKIVKVSPTTGANCKIEKIEPFNTINCIRK